MKLSEIIDLLSSNDPEDLIRADKEAHDYHEEMFQAEDDVNRWPTFDHLLQEISWYARVRANRLSPGAPLQPDADT